MNKKLIWVAVVMTVFVIAAAAYARRGSRSRTLVRPTVQVVDPLTGYAGQTI